MATAIHELNYYGSSSWIAAANFEGSCRKTHDFNYRPSKKKRMEIKKIKKFKRWHPHKIKKFRKLRIWKYRCYRLNARAVAIQELNYNLVDCGSLITAAAIHEVECTSALGLRQLVDCSGLWIGAAAIHNDAPQLEPFYTVPTKHNVCLVKRVRDYSGNPG